MVKNGAGKLVYMSRSGLNGASQEVHAMISEFKAQGTSVEVLKGDVTNFSDVESAVEVCGQKMKGIVHGAMVLQVGISQKPSLQILIRVARISYLNECRANNSVR